MCREINDAILVERCSLNCCDGRRIAKLNVLRACVQRLCDRAQLVGGFRKRWERFGERLGVSGRASIERGPASVERSRFRGRMRCSGRKLDRQTQSWALPQRQQPFAPRRTLRLATEGKIVIAYLRTSQSAEPRSFPSGSLVTSTCGGRLVSAPSRTNDRRAFLEMISSTGPSSCR